MFDGHGGRDVALYVSEHFPNILLNALKINPPQEAFKKAYQEMDDKVASQVKEKSGSTAVTILIRKEGDQRVIHSANCGDARAVLWHGLLAHFANIVSRGGTAVRLSKDHKASDEEEVTRIQNAQGVIMQNKVAGALAVARAFGDHELKKWVISEPYLYSTPVQDDDTHIIIACDGVNISVVFFD